MTKDEETLLIIKGTIMDLDQEMREKVEAHYAELRSMIDKSPLAVLAIAWMGAELQAKNAT